MDFGNLRAVAVRQHGVVSLTQALASGLTRRQWRDLTRRRLIVELFPGAGLLAGAAATELARIKAATLAVGPSAMASHTSAAAVWGVEVRGDDPVHVIVGDRRRHLAAPGLLVHRPRDVTELEPILRRGIPTTRPPRTLCDLGAVDERALGAALLHFLAEGTLSVDAARRALARHRGRGRSGAVALERALGDLAHLSKPPDSELEVVMARLFRGHRLPPFEFHARIAGWEVDFLIVGTCVVIETDGWMTHGVEREQFERDRAKDADLQAAGYVVQRFTWQQVTRDQMWVAERIRALVRRWAPEVMTG